MKQLKDLHFKIVDHYGTTGMFVKDARLLPWLSRWPWQTVKRDSGHIILLPNTISLDDLFVKLARIGRPVFDNDLNYRTKID